MSLLLLGEEAAASPARGAGEVEEADPGKGCACNPGGPCRLGSQGPLLPRGKAEAGGPDTS